MHLELLNCISKRILWNLIIVYLEIPIISEKIFFLISLKTKSFKHLKILYWDGEFNIKKIRLTFKQIGQIGIKIIWIRNRFKPYLPIYQVYKTV